MILPHHPDIPNRETGLKFIGYWRGKAAGLLELSDPHEFVDRKWSRREMVIVLGHLRTGEPWEHWMGPSWCRFGCDHERADLGCSDLTDGVYVWPSGFAHYVDKHDVRPAQEFIDHVMRRRPGS